MSKEQSAGEEQRKFPRVSESCDVKYQIVEDDTVQHNGQEGSAVNISGGGVCFESDTELPKGSMMVMEIELPQFPSAVVALGKVAWCKDIPGDKYEVGVEFWWIGWREQDAQAAMLDYINQKLSDRA
jgi:hypothetical protein